MSANLWERCALSRGKLPLPIIPSRPVTWCFKCFGWQPLDSWASRFGFHTLHAFMASYYSVSLASVESQDC